MGSSSGFNSDLSTLSPQHCLSYSLYFPALVLVLVVVCAPQVLLLWVVILCIDLSGISSFGGRDLPCDINSMMDLRRGVDFQVFLLVSCGNGSDSFSLRIFYAELETKTNCVCFVFWCEQFLWFCLSNLCTNNTWRLLSPKQHIIFLHDFNKISVYTQYMSTCSCAFLPVLQRHRGSFSSLLTPFPLCYVIPVNILLYSLPDIFTPLSMTYISITIFIYLFKFILYEDVYNSL